MLAKKKICTGCQTPQYIWKNHEGGRYCKTCAGVLIPGKSKQIPTVRKPIPSRSPKRSKEERLYAGKRIIFLDKFPICQVHLPHCSTESTDVHHRMGRVGELLLKEEFWLSTCRQCHNYIELNPAWAIEKGFSLLRNSNESEK